MMLFFRIFRRALFRLCCQPESAQIREQMPKDLQLITRRKAIELEHDRGIQRRDVAVPDVACHAGEKYIGVTTFERARYGQLGDGMALSEILAQKKRVDAGCVAAHDHVLVIVWKNL